MSLSNSWLPWLICFCVIGLYSYLHPAEALEALVGPAVDVISSPVSTASADGIHSPSTYYKLTLTCRKQQIVRITFLKVNKQQWTINQINSCHLLVHDYYSTCGIDTNILDCKNNINHNRMYVSKVTWNTVFSPYIRPFFITAKKIYLMLNDENDITCIVIEAKTVWRLVVQNDI